MIREVTAQNRCISSCLVSGALDGMCIGLVTLDVAGRITWANRAALSVLGRRLSECEGELFGHVLRDPKFSAFWHDVESSGQGGMGEVQIRWPRRATLKVNATHCTDPQGHRIGRAVIFCDVTAERLIQVQLSQEATERLLRATQPDVPAAETASEGLTGQEVKVLSLVGEGLGNAEIASRLFVAPSTVRSHLKQVYRKTGLRTRAEAVRYAVENGLVGSAGSSCGL